MKGFTKRLVSCLLICLISAMTFAPMAAVAATTYTEQEVACSKCAGTGKRACWKCEGTGQDRSSKCRVCDGSGRRTRCSTCDGSGNIITQVAATSTVPDSTVEANTFVGTIGEKKVTAYLDDTYQFRMDGETDYNGEFLIYDSDGNPTSMLSIRIFEGKSAKTYTGGDKYSSGFSFSYYPEISDDFVFGSRYSTGGSAKDWTITLTEAESSSTGIFSGTINAVLQPAEYGGGDLTGMVQIAGSFNMRMQEVHSIAEEYRKTHSDYDTAHPHNFYQYESMGDDFSDNSSSSTQKNSNSSEASSPSSPEPSSSSANYRCNICKDSKLCQRCHGQQRYLTSGNFWVDCGRCHGSGHCSCYYRW